MAMAKDQTLKLGPAAEWDILSPEGGKLAQRGRVMFHTDFEGGGFEGWRDHFDSTTTPRPPAGLTSYPTYAGSHALTVPYAPESPYNATDLANGSGSYKNLSRFRDTGLVSFSGFFTLYSGGGARAWASWGIGLDTQKWDSSTRGFYKLTCVGVDSGTTPKWRLTNDTGGDPVEITAALGNEAGQNEGKFNFNYVRLTVDLSANGGLGGYYEAQINNHVYDLAGLGAGRGSLAPQAGAGDYTDFKGGMNAAIFASRSTNPSKANLYPGWIVADELALTVGDQAA